jgi:glutaconate CoA-transferase subunit B
MTDEAKVTDFTVDELMVACIARQVVDGEVLAQGIATPLVAAGYILAQCTHAPHVTFASAIGQGLCQDWAPLGVARIEELWLDKAVTFFGFVRAATEVLPSLAPKEFFRPGQVDRHGNFNNLALTHPRMRLPGAGGIPDVTTFSDEVYLYVPRHSRATFVPKLDWVSGLGHSSVRTRGAGPRYLISDLGQFDFADGVMRLTSLHPGVTFEQVQARTGFPLTAAPDLSETTPPTTEEIRLLREDIDPLGVRKLELLSGGARKDLLREILQREGAL